MPPPESQSPDSTPRRTPDGARATSGSDPALSGLTLPAFQPSSRHRDALQPVEAALQYHRASAQGHGAPRDAAVGCEPAEVIYRAGAQGLRLSEIPQLPQQLRELSRSGPGKGKTSAIARFPSPIRRRTTIAKTLAQCLHNLWTQPESRLRQTGENIVKFHQTCGSRIGEQTCRPGDSQAKGTRNLSASLLIQNQQAGTPVLPSQRDRRCLAGIERTGFFQIHLNLRHHRNPIGTAENQIPQALRCMGMNRFTTHGFGHMDFAIKPVEQIQLADLREAGQHRIVTDDDHGMACRNSDELRASARISSADCPGQAPCLPSTACASQRDSKSSILRTCSSDSTSLEYASVARASSAARLRFWNSEPSSAARSSGMFTVKVIPSRISHTAPIRKPQKRFPIPKHPMPTALLVRLVS